MNGDIQIDEFDPCGNWVHGGRTIEDRKICLVFDFVDWHAGPHDTLSGKGEHKSSEPLVAAMRCVVETGLEADEIEIPDELMEASHDQHIG